MMADPMWESLRAEVGGDLRPVKPVRLARRAAAWSIPLLLLVFAVPLWRHGLREDASVLGPFALWGVSALAIVLGLRLIMLGLREAVPGRRTHLWLLGGGILAMAVCHFGGAMWTWTRSPLAVPADRFGEIGVACLAMEIAFGLPVVLVALALARTGLVRSYLRLGLWVGVGAGLLGDGLWRLVCPYNDLWHVLTAHSLGVVLTVGFAALGAWILDRTALAAWRRRRASGSSDQTSLPS